MGKKSQKDRRVEAWKSGSEKLRDVVRGGKGSGVVRLGRGDQTWRRGERE